MREHVQELPEIKPVADISLEERVDDPLTQRIDCDLRYAQQIIPAECAAVTSVQSGEPRVQSFDLVRCNWNE